MKFSEIGIEGFYYDLPPSGGKLRSLPEDFIVEECYEGIERSDHGNVLVLKLKAKNWEHNRLVKFLARIYHVSPNRVYFSGTKDRRSVKIQYFSIPGVSFRDIRLMDVEVLEHFYVERPLALGSHSFNKFVIVVRECDADAFSANCIRLRQSGTVPNFYGPQRFGPLRPVTHLVGREIVKRNYEEAVRIFVGFPGEDRFSSVRKEFYETMNVELALQEFPDSLDLEIRVLRYLKENRSDFMGAIKQLPSNLVSMFIHAYQGYLFNRILSERIRASKTVEIGDIFRLQGQLIRVNSLNLEKLREEFERGSGSPTGLVVGHESEMASGMMGEIEGRVMKEEGVTPLDFRLPFGLSSKGERRDLYLRILEMECHDSTASFSLPPGGYATSVMREIMRVDEMGNY
ncbi:MAG: tRNA pseudouridine(13) synthase TruD [Thermoplasmata archaeon]